MAPSAGSPVAASPPDEPAHRRSPAALGGPAPVPLIRGLLAAAHASRAVDRLLHHSLGRRFRSVAAARARRTARPVAVQLALSALPHSRSRSLLAAGGLASSAFHLAGPRRAWRAFSQWRSSWLSREGVFSVLTFLPAAVFGIGWVFFGDRPGIGRSLRHPRRSPRGGDDLLHRHDLRVAEADPSMAQPMGRAELFRPRPDERSPYSGFSRPAVAAACAGCGNLGGGPGGCRVVAEGRVLALDRYDLGAQHVASATLLGSRGKVRMLEPPHTEENYLLKEMGFAIARKHRVRLRGIVRLAGFALPGLLTLLALVVGGVIGLIAAGLAVAVAGLGLVAERWLFFAEAKHTVMLYYGAEVV